MPARGNVVEEEDTMPKAIAGLCDQRLFTELLGRLWFRHAVAHPRHGEYVHGVRGIVS